MYYLARAKMDAVTPYKPSQRQGEKNPVAPARGGTPSLGRWGHIRAPHWQSLSPKLNQQTTPGYVSIAFFEPIWVSQKKWAATSKLL
jgi:hypothetical protein